VPKGHSQPQKNLPKIRDRIIREPKVKEVSVTLNGTEQEFSMLKPRELKLSADMSSVKDGENKFLLSRDLVRNNAGLSVVNIDPDEIYLVPTSELNSSWAIDSNTLTGRYKYYIKASFNGQEHTKDIYFNVTD